MDLRLQLLHPRYTPQRIFHAMPERLHLLHIKLQVVLLDCSLLLFDLCS
jgi:hypothetical protein